MTHTIIIQPSRESLRPLLGPPNASKLKRTLWSVCARSPQGQRPHIIMEGTQDDARPFLSRAKFTLLETFSLETAISLAGETLFLLTDTIVWGSALDAMISEAPSSPPFCVTASVFGLSSLIQEKLDDWGANLHQGMVEHCMRHYPVSTPLVHGRVHLLCYRSKDWSENEPVIRSEKSVGLLQWLI